MPIIKSPLGDYVVDAYEPKNYPENQNWYQGFPLNPTMRVHFDNTPNEQREQKEIDDWWGLPYIELETWEQREQHTRRIQAQHRADQNEYVLSDEALDQKIADERSSWHAAWPSGTRYDVRCLDGGAWDRSLGWGMVATLEEAVELCQNGPKWRRAASSQTMVIVDGKAVPLE